MRLGKIRYLQTDQEFELFIERAYEKIGVRFPLDYLKSNRTIGYFDAEGELQGGCAFILNGPFRVVESLPPEGIQRFRELAPDLNQVFELTGLWLNRKAVSGTGSALFWVRMYVEAVKTGRSHILYAYSASKPKLGQIYQVAQPQEIFRGDTKMLKGMDEPDREVIEIAAMRNVHKAWVTQPHFLIKRIIKKSSRRRELAKKQMA